MRTQELFADSITEILLLLKLNYQEKNYSEEQIAELLRHAKFYLENALGKNFVIYGLFNQEELIALVGTNVIYRPVETIAQIAFIYTKPSYRDHHYQSTILMPFFWEQIRKKGINIIETNDLDKNCLISPKLMSQLFETPIKTTTYSIKSTLINPQRLPDEYYVQTSLINDHSFFADFLDLSGKTLLQAVVDYALLFPTLENYHCTQATINIYHIAIPASYEEVQSQERLFLEELLRLIKQSGISCTKVSAYNLSKEVLLDLGFCPHQNETRGINPIFGMRSKISPKI